MAGCPRHHALHTYRGAFFLCDGYMFTAAPLFQHLVELSIDIVERNRNSPPGIIAVIRLPALQYLSVAGYFPSSPLSWVSGWDLPELRFLSVRSTRGEEAYLPEALDRFGGKLTNLYLGGPFALYSLQEIATQCPQLVHLEFDWTESFMPFSCPPKLRKVVFHNTAWLTHWLHSHFVKQIRQIHQHHLVEWSSLEVIQDMSVTSGGGGRRKVQWWPKEDLMSVQGVGIRVIDCEEWDLRVENVECVAPIPGGAAIW